ncbi:PemK family protein [Clostridium perfringens D str. JGS1721]|uniref:PemK family protein n=1 Tax=Clostridium perfringens D str. JGS1721 TaxID=488537 RepID=B1V552_CLOPF|nr:type II toxin-antitoxin system PemK/MazF family toxin [Clostridium perfringens]EDT71054.1 PemK family protein [Clostridium perfringens D str. JGS1721]
MRTIRSEFLKINPSRAYLRGDIFYADLPDQKGSEQNGLRPVVIIQNNLGNKHSRTLIVAPITSQNKNDLSVHSKIYSKYLEKDSTILLEQITTIDKNKVKNFVGCLTNSELKDLNRALAISVGLMDLNSLEFII